MGLMFSKISVRRQGNCRLIFFCVVVLWNEKKVVTLWKNYCKKYMEEKVALPNYILGISTNKNDVEQRRNIVKKEYPLLLSKLMNKTGKKKIHNDFLNVEVNLVMREGGKEATNRSTFNWQSTYAILKLETVVKKAVSRAGEPIYVLPKETGNQKAYKYVNMAVLYYDFVDAEKWYMNFTVRLVLGIKSDGRHTQYSVNKIETI
jgi:hypothetical protein